MKLSPSLDVHLAVRFLQPVLAKRGLTEVSLGRVRATQRSLCVAATAQPKPYPDTREIQKGVHLHPHELDADRRLVRYRAKAHVCNACLRKPDCTDSDRGREIVRPLDPWPHSEAGRFHRGISLALVRVAVLIVVVEALRHHEPAEAATLFAVLGAALATGALLARDFRAHPANFPAPSPSQGLGRAVALREDAKAE